MAHLFNQNKKRDVSIMPVNLPPAPPPGPAAPPPPPPQMAGPVQVNPTLSYNQTFNPATDPMLAAIGGVVPTGPSLQFTPTQAQADAAWQFQNAPIDAYNQQANAFNTKNAKKIAKGKMEAMPVKQSFAKPVIDPSMSYDISQYNPYDPYGTMNQMAMSAPAATGIDNPNKTSKYAPTNPFMIGTPEYAMWTQTYGAGSGGSKQNSRPTGGSIGTIVPRQYGNEY